MLTQPLLFNDDVAEDGSAFAESPRGIRWGGPDVRQSTMTVVVGGTRVSVETLTGQFWTSRQRDAHSLHEIPYRAAFKAALPRFFIERLTKAGDVVHDPFMGRGTTLVEAMLLGRRPAGSDANPLCRMIVEPRLAPPPLDAVRRRLAEIDWRAGDHGPADLLVFFHADTLRSLNAIRSHFARRRAAGTLDDVDTWVRMIAASRLTGHSPGFCSVRTLPPNQAVSVDAQRRLNQKHGLVPPPRDVARIVLDKSTALLADWAGGPPQTRGPVLTAHAASTPKIADASVDLVVTSPPFLDVVDYAADHWLRMWFCDIDPRAVALTQTRRVDAWRAAMTDALSELRRVLRPGGHVAFEVGEVRGGSLRLEEHVVPCGVAAGLEPLVVLVNEHRFTKTAHCWGVENNTGGTNTNRVVVFTTR